MCDYPPTRHEIDEWYPDNKIPQDAIIHYQNSWCDWSWGGFIIVYEYQGKFFGIVNDDDYIPFEMTAEEALDTMLEWEEDIGSY